MNELPKNWQYTTIGELCNLTNGTVQTGPFGSDLHAGDYSEYGTPVIMPANLGKNRIIEAGIARVDDTHVARLSNHKVIKGDIVFPRRGDVARYVVVDEPHVGWLCGTGCLRIRFGTNEAIEPQFLGYWLGTAFVENWLLSNAVGTTMPNLNTSILKALPVPLPPINEQREIAHILSSLDDKINLNHRMNATLEATARALFQSWFVDFDPVRAKAEGRQPEGMDAETAALFPDEFEKSELGLIPKGWTVQPLSEHVKVAKGLSYKGSGLADYGNGMPMHNLNSVYEGGGYKYEGMKHYTGDYQDRHIVKAGDLIVTNTEQGHNLLLIGYPALVPNRYPEGLFSHHLYRVTPLETSHITSRFLYFLMRTDFFHEVIGGYTNGTTVNMLPVDGLQRPLFVVPPPELVVRFEQIVAPILAKMEVNREASGTLAETRDALLPKLISGAIRIDSIDKLTED